MRWNDTAPRKAINLGAGMGVPADPTLYRVCILKVTESDPLPPAFAEFWRRVLTEGPELCRGRWEILLFPMNLLGGGFTCVFTSRDLDRDEPPVFKFSAAALEAACYALPERPPGDPRADTEYQELENRCLDQLRAAARDEPAAGLWRALRERGPFEAMCCDFYRNKRWPLDPQDADARRNPP
jgi:hypothetical protein